MRLKKALIIFLFHIFQMIEEFYSRLLEIGKSISIKENKNELETSLFGALLVVLIFRFERLN